jgi:SAM-dependent methyltransferase
MSDNDKVNTGHNLEDKELIKNARKPVGELGNQILDRMNESHETMAVWGVSHFDIAENDVILDIGCGGGRNIERFAAQVSSGKVIGIDYSEVSVEKSTQLNRKAIGEGKVEVIQGSVSEMPFEDNSFDIVTGFETIYFWPDFINDLKEVNRVLKKDGMVFFCNEAVYREGKMEKYEDLIELLDMKIYSEDVLKESLEKTGFKDFKAYIHEENDWICVTARKI